MSCSRCEGSPGWIPVHVLNTVERYPSGAVYTKKERISAQVAADIQPKLGPNQRIYSGVDRCPCNSKVAA